MTILWSPEAIEDLTLLRAYIADDNPAAARGVVLHIIHNIEQLKPTNPVTGWIWPHGFGGLSRTPIPPPASLSRKQIPACSKAAWIRIRVKTSAPHAQDNWLGFTRPIINAAWVCLLYTS